MVSHYTPERGDIVWINLSPQAGHEQSGRRPALIISPVSYNRKAGLAILCPVTSQVKGYPFEVTIASNDKINGVILADQVKSLDWKIRKANFIYHVSNSTVQEVLKKLNTLIIFYMLAAVIMPSLGMAMAVVVSSFINFPIGLREMLVFVFFVMVIQFIFISLFRAVRPMVEL